MQSIAQAGLTFGADRYDLERYEKMMVEKKINSAWSLPCGWADVNTSLSESAIRETDSNNINIEKSILNNRNLLYQGATGDL